MYHKIQVIIADQANYKVCTKCAAINDASLEECHVCDNKSFNANRVEKRAAEIMALFKNNPDLANTKVS